MTCRDIGPTVAIAYKNEAECLKHANEAFQKRRFDLLEQGIVITSSKIICLKLTKGREA